MVLKVGRGFVVEGRGHDPRERESERDYGWSRERRKVTWCGGREGV